MVAFGSPVVPEVKPSSATSSRPVLTASNFTGLSSAMRSSSASWLEVPSKLTTCLRNLLSLAQAINSSAMRLSHSARRDLGLVDDLAELAGAQHRHGVDHHGAGLGGGEPGRDQRRIVAGADEHAVAGLDAVILDQRIGEPVRPVGEFLVGAAAAVADQRDAVAEAALDVAVGQFDRGVQVFRILEFRPVEDEVGPLIERRKIVAREGVDMRGRTELWRFSWRCHVSAPPRIRLPGQ